MLIDMQHFIEEGTKFISRSSSQHSLAFLEYGSKRSTKMSLLAAQNQAQTGLMMSLIEPWRTGNMLDES